MSYVEIPMLINYKDKKAVSFAAGVCVGRLINYNYSENGYPALVPRDLNLDKNKIDYSAVAEASYNFLGNLWINLRYQYSIVPFSTNNVSSKYKRFGAFHNSVGIRIKYVFNPMGGNKKPTTSDEVN
jgi:hypothetical protein